MPTKKLVMTLLGLILSQNLWAGVLIKPSFFSTQKACENIEGQWVGEGKINVSAGPLSPTCMYSGTGNLIRDIAPDTFKMDIFLYVKSGMCPDDVHVVLPGKCHDGIVSLETFDADISGSLNEEGTSAELNGTVNVPIMGRKVTATIEEMHLHKQ